LIWNVSLVPTQVGEIVKVNEVVAILVFKVPVIVIV